MNKSMSEPLTLPPCRVCGGTATGIHYGVNTCEACKAFFRRSLVENNKYVCPRDGDCKIINHKRANCSACRLKKCLDLGMSKKAVRHGRYTVAIRTKTILEVKQLEREQALKDSFALADSFAKHKMPEIISVPQERTSPDSSVSSSAISSFMESSDYSSSIEESSNFPSSFIESTSICSSDNLQSSVVGSTCNQISLCESLLHSLEENSQNMVSLETSAVFSSSIDDQMIDNLDILSTMDIDIPNDNIISEISGSDVFLNSKNSHIDIDLTSDKIDFLEINSDEYINFSQEVINVFQSSTQDQLQSSTIQQSCQESPEAPDCVQQRSPDTTTVDDSGSSQFISHSNMSDSSSRPDFTSVAQKKIPTFNFTNSMDSFGSTLTAPPQKKLRASFNMADDMETLQLINTLVSAQEILYPSMRKHFNKEYTDVIHREFWEKHKLHDELFGTLKGLSNAEYNSFFLATGIDIDGRIDMLTKAAECMQKEIVKYISFVKSIPGWEDLHNSDKLTLIKASRFEYWLLGKYLQINPELGVTANENCGFTHKQILQMWGNPENMDAIHNFTKKLKKLDLTFEEIALMRGIVVLSRDRFTLREPEIVEKMQWRILQSFIHLIKKTHPHEPLRFARCMDKITQLRELTDLNYKANKNLENFQKSLIQNYPLLYECFTFEG